MEYDLDQIAQQTRILLDRLERLSADSKWAHRASGFRGSLLRELINVENGNPDLASMKHLIDQGYRILVSAARDIPDPESI